MTSTTPMTPTTAASNSRPATPPTPSPAESKRAMYTTKNEIKFPFRLHEMLEDAEKKGFDHIIAWLPEGDGFRILDANAFADEVMPRYFTMSHFKSFQRQLSLYSFKRETEGRKRDAYCHPYFRRENRDLCVYVPREKKRPPKTKKSRSKYNRTHRRALSSEEVRNLMNSPSVSPLSEDFENRGSSVRPVVTTSTGPSPSFFAEADQIQQRSPVRPMPQRPVHPQWQTQHQHQQSQLPPGRPLQFPIQGKPNPSRWMQDHDANLWSYVNGLVVDTSQAFNNKNELAKEASNFSTDEILSEIASTFNANQVTESDRSSSLGSENSNISGISNATPLPAYPSPTEPRKQSYNGATFYGV